MRAKADGSLHGLRCRLYFDMGAYAHLGGEVMELATEAKLRLRMMTGSRSFPDRVPKPELGNAPGVILHP